MSAVVDCTLAAVCIAAAMVAAVLTSKITFAVLKFPRVPWPTF
jgi:hypothetical protein